MNKINKKNLYALKRCFLMIICFAMTFQLLSVSVFGATQSIVIDGLKYDLLDNNTANVTGYDGSMPTGTITVPGIIDYNDKQYTVIKISAQALRYCTGIVEVVLPTSLQVIDNYAFQGCTALEEINLPDSLITIGSYAFNNCTVLKGITLPNSLTTLSNNAFTNCKGLTSIKIPPLIKKINPMTFSGCNNIKTIELNEGLQEIGNMAFSNMDSVTSLTIPSTVKTIHEAAFSTANTLTLQSYIVDPNNPNFTSVDGVIFSKDMTKLCFYPTGNPATTYTIPDTVRSIWGQAFYYSNNLKNICLTRDTFEASGMYMFDMSYGLETLVVDGIELNLMVTGGIYLDKTYPMTLLDSTNTLQPFNRAMGYSYPDGNDTLVFCIEPEVGADTFGILVPDLNAESNDVINILGNNHADITRYTPEVLQLVAWCVKLADVQIIVVNQRLSPEQSLHYIVAQSIIYEIVRGNYTEARKSEIINKINKDYGSEAATYATQLIALIDDEANRTIIDAIPSFTSLTQADKPTYEFAYNDVTNKYTITLTDTNGVLDKFKVVGDSLPSGVTAQIVGNDLIVSSDNPVTAVNDIKLEPMDSTVVYRELHIIYHPTNQLKIMGDTIDITDIQVHFAIKSNNVFGDLIVSKSVSGNAGDTDKEFVFMVTLEDDTINEDFGDMHFEDGVATFTLKHGQSKSATRIPAGMNYTVVESDNDGYIVTKTNDEGMIVTNEETKVTFNNFKSVAKISLHASKTVNDETPTSNSFTFNLKDSTGDTIQTKNNTGGTITFDELTFSEEGTYTFTLEEVNGEQPGYIYDDNIITAIIRVVRNTTTKELEATVVYQKDNKEVGTAVFENRYIPDSVVYNPQVIKQIKGDTPKENSIFTFQLIGETLDTPMPFGSNEGIRKTSVVGAGKADFGNITYEEEGEYRYTIIEILGNEKGYQYDNSIYTLVVTVENKDGKLVASGKIEETGASQAQFTNTYKIPINNLEVYKSSDREVAQVGDVITYKITVKNTGNQELIGIRVRDYVPEYTLFEEAYDNGDYGVINGKEHVTWFIESIAPGEEVTLQFKVIVDACVPDNYAISNIALYEVTNTPEKPNENDPRDPGYLTNEVRNPTPGAEAMVKPNTGDNHPIGIFTTLLVSMMATLGYLVYRRKKEDVV